MAYDQGYYQAPARPYYGRAAQPPAQAYSQPSMQSQYPPQDYPQQGPYDQYAQDDYHYNSHDNGYPQQYDNQYQQPMNGGGRGGPGRGGYPPNQGYPHPPKQYGYSNGGGRGGGDMRPPHRNDGRGGPGAYPQPRRPDTATGHYEDRGYGPPHGGGPGNRNAPPPMGRGGRPAPLDRAATSDPESTQRPPVAPSQKSPQDVAWDNPFPTFPGTKKKSSNSEEQNLTKGMAGMDLNGSRNDSGRPKTAGNQYGQDPSPRRGPMPDGGGRPSMDSQRGPPRGYPPQQPQQPGYGSQGPPSQGYGRPPQKQFDYGYNDQEYGPQSQGSPMSPVRDGFDQIPRSMTMPAEIPTGPPMGGNSSSRAPAQIVDPTGPSVPYNGPVGRVPPRPSTATAAGARPPPQRQYPPQSQEQYGNGNSQYNENSQASHQPVESISDLYDAYYNTSPQRNGNGRYYGSENPEYNGGRRGTSFDDQMRGDSQGQMPPRQQVNGYAPESQHRSQPDSRAQVQPQSAVYEMIGDAPPMPNGFAPQGQANGRYESFGNQAPMPRGQGSPERKHGSYDQGMHPEFGQPQRGMTGPDGFANGSLPNGPASNPNRISPPRADSLPRGPNSSESLPPHPAPVRPGLMPTPQANNKPPPIRNYSNTAATVTPQTISQAQPPRSPAIPEVTLDELERLKAAAKANPSDQEAQFMLARKEILAADYLAPRLPDPKQRTKARERYVLDAHKILKKLAALNNAEAMFFLADCYGRGSLGLEADNKEAFALYQSAAKAGHAAAAYRTAVCCELGNEEGGGTRKDPLKAIQWYKRAAALGDTPAMYKMGMIQLKGLLGQPKNAREAIVWLKRAAEQADAENPHALHELALLYESPQPPDGSGVIIRDEPYAFHLFTQAAELGYKFSQFRLGAAYEYGLFNLAIDPRLSIMWYSRAAVQEEHQSELALSGWYLTGANEAATGKPILQQSDTEAYLWARKAAMAGLAKAEYAMGYFTEVGIGAPSDLEGAKRWYWRAAAQNFPKARERLEDLKKAGSRPQPKTRERISRSKIGKQNEGDCVVM